MGWSTSHTRCAGTNGRGYICAAGWIAGLLACVETVLCYLRFDCDGDGENHCDKDGNESEKRDWNYTEETERVRDCLQRDYEIAR